MVREHFTNEVTSEWYLKEVVVIYMPEKGPSRPKEEQVPGP